MNYSPSRDSGGTPDYGNQYFAEKRFRGFVRLGPDSVDDDVLARKRELIATHLSLYEDQDGFLWAFML